MRGTGYWQQPGGGYGKYRGTIWQIMLLAELGADATDGRVQRGCDYLLDHSVAGNGGFAFNMRPVPSGVVHCLNGNLLGALIRLGRLDDPRMQPPLDWQVRAIRGEEPIRYYPSGTSGPNFACALNEKQPCAWGATKAMKALIAVSPERRSLAGTPFGGSAAGAGGRCCVLVEPRPVQSRVSLQRQGEPNLVQARLSPQLLE